MAAGLRGTRWRSLGLVLLLLAAVPVWLLTFAFNPVAVPPAARDFVVEKGDSLRQVSRGLVLSGVLGEGLSFTWMGRLLGRASQLKPGSYALPERIRPIDLLDQIARGDAAPTQVIVVEGWSFAQLRAALGGTALLRHDSQALSEGEILLRIGAAEERAEGLFFPDTYFFSPGSRDLDLFSRAYRRMQLRLQTLWNERAPGLPYATAYEALVMASLVEKETGRAEDRALVAAVFLNRLSLHMRLQTDPSVIYGLGARYDGHLLRADLERDTPFNTYTRAGLPPSPIASPGLAAMQAALHPANSKALYFVARGDGSSQFSRNLREHNRAVQQYLRSP